MYVKCSIIIVNWNGKRHLMDCLSSVYLQDYPSFEVILVDNGSTDDSVQFVKNNFPRTRVIKNSRNLGFAAGTNIGIRASRGDYIATLNNDTRVESDWLQELVKVAEKNDLVGSCSSKMLKYDNPTTIDSTGIELFENGSVVDRGFGKKDNDQYEEMKEVFGACAGAALYKKAMLDQIGLFPSRYFVNYEDVDIAWRAQYAGWKCVYVPSAVVYHVRCATQDKLDHEQRSYLSQRNQLYYRVKYLPNKHLIRYSPSIARSYLRLIIRKWRNRSFDMKNIFEPAIALKDRVSYFWYFKSNIRCLPRRDFIQRFCGRKDVSVEESSTGKN